jgi:hypothetical protein
MQKRKKNEYRNEGEEELPGAEEAVALVLLLLLEAVPVLVLLEAEAVDSRTAVVALLLVAEREVLPHPLSSVSFPFRFLPFLLLLWFSFPPFSFLSVLSFPLPFLSLSVFSFSSTLLCFSRFFPPSLSVLLALFIEPRGGAFYGCTWGARAAAVGRPFGCSCRGTASPFFLVGARRVVGQWAWLARSGSLGFLARHAVQREVAHLQKKNQPFFFLPLLHVQGRKKEEQCRSKRHRSDPFFFFFT